MFIFSQMNEIASAVTTISLSLRRCNLRRVRLTQNMADVSASKAADQANVHDTNY